VTVEKISLTEKFASFNDTWVPRVVGELNGQYVKVVKFEGEYVWHHHENEDEMFLVVDGQMTMHLRDGDVELNEGEFIVIPRGVEHKPEAKSRAQVLLFEPATTRNTGNVDHEYTIEPGELDRI
jgi:mannose-6-phosphate isomerase-like protein (cupin superfamily)